MVPKKSWMGLVSLAWVAVPGLFAQTADVAFRWAYLRSPTQPESWVVADLRAPFVRDASGAIDSGGVVTRLRYSLRDEMTLTAVRVHRASDGAVIFQSQPPPITMRGRGAAVVPWDYAMHAGRGDRAALEAFRRLVEDPPSHFVSLATREQPEGGFRGQVLNVEYSAVISLPTADPAIPAERRPKGVLVGGLFVGRDASAKPAYGEILWQVHYRYPAQVTFAGLHIRYGAVGDGPILISAPLAGVASDPSGAGYLGVLWTQILPENDVAFRALLELRRAPGDFSMTLHAGTQPEGTLRGRLRPTERINFQLQFSARNVVPPPPNWEASSPSSATFFVLRREDGSVAAANLLATTSLRFPEPVKVLRNDIRRGDAATNGPDLMRYG